jgi:hypothetical protein
MFNVSICEYFSVLNVFIICIRNTARSKSIPLLCTHVDLYKFSTVHPLRVAGSDAVVLKFCLWKDCEQSCVQGPMHTHTDRVIQII